jgi:hypothetical protein
MDVSIVAGELELMWRFLDAHPWRSFTYTPLLSSGDEFEALSHSPIIQTDLSILKSVVF